MEQMSNNTSFVQELSAAGISRVRHRKRRCLAPIFAYGYTPLSVLPHRLGPIEIDGRAIAAVTGGGALCVNRRSSFEEQISL